MPATDAIAHLNSALAGRYEIERELGAGGMATVYLAHDLKHDRKVALKVLRHDIAQTVGAERFLREIHMAAKLSHPHILPLFDSGTAGGFVYYAMPNVEGSSLRDRLNRESKLPVDEAVRVTQEIADALDYAHRHGVIHRDVKPENIMLQDGHAFMADFGIGKAVSGTESEMFTKSGATLGTPAYMSPEQAAGESLDGRSDLYSLGCVLYEMLTGEQPFTGSTVQAVIAKRFVQTPADVTALREGVPHAVARAVHRALARTPIDRFETGASFLAALREPDAQADAKPAAPEKSIAVLPFANMSADPENEFFADGITEEILNALAHSADLRVAGRTSSFSFKGKQLNLRAIGEQLGVRTALEGSVRRAGNRVRITAQLVDCVDGYQLWSERYDREIEDVFAVQDEIATAIAERLKTTLMAGRSARREQRAPENIAAWEAYLKGRTLIYRRGAAVREGMALMRRALELDPEYALAWAGLADAYSVQGYFGVLPPEECGPPAREAATKALAWGPDLAEAHTAAAMVSLLFEWDWPQTERSFKRALELNPGYVQAGGWYSIFYLGMACGRWEEANDLALRIQNLDPLSAYSAVVIAWTMGLEGKRMSEAVQWARKACDLEPASFLELWSLQRTLYFDGQFTESIEAGEQALRVSGRHPWALSQLAVTYVDAGDVASARAIFREMEARAVREYAGPLPRAIAAAAVGEHQTAIDLVRESVARRDPELALFPPQQQTAHALRALPETQEIYAALKYPSDASSHA